MGEFCATIDMGFGDSSYKRIGHLTCVSQKGRSLHMLCKTAAEYNANEF